MTTAVPAPGALEPSFPSVAALLRRNAVEHGERVALVSGDTRWTHAELYAESARYAALFRSWREEARPLHVGVLLDNVPEYVFVLGGAALAGAAVVGLNPTRQGSELRRDIEHTDLGAIVTEARHAGLLDDAGVGNVRVVTTDELPALLPTDPGRPDPEPALGTTWCLIFTSGTSSAPKAVICSHRRMLGTGERMRAILDVGPDDVGYLCMPLFHSNSLMVGLMPALVAGGSVALAPRFSASGWLPDVRRYGVTYWNYTGKPLAYVLATPARPDDADNTLLRAYGNEGNDRLVAQFAERFGVEVIDAFGPTEGGIGIIRGTGDPAGSLGHAGDAVRVVDDSGAELPRAAFSTDGALLNAEDAVGEIVNVSGPGSFEGYYNNDEAFARATRNGWYWSGDLGYIDDAGYVYFAGRTAEWLRVDGENFPAGPIEAAVARHPALLAAAVYGVPDPAAGDAVMACLVVAEGARFDPASFASWLDAQPELGPKWRPRWLRISAALPMTPSQKVLHRKLQSEKWRGDRVGGDEIWVRDRDTAEFRPFTRADEAALRAEFADGGRDRFWDL